jgi:Leucine-rich repeat (LRR) protein
VVVVVVVVVVVLISSIIVNLRELDVAHNCITHISEGVLPLMPLQDLDLSANMLKSLPSDLGGSHLPQLTQVS